MDIPIELFALAMGSSFVFVIIGLLRNPQIPAMIAFAGMFILFIAVTTDKIIMNDRIDNINKTNVTDSYTYVNNSFEFTELPKVVFALIGVFLMLSGGIMGVKS
jgi:hypothetical protein